MKKDGPAIKQLFKKDCTNFIRQPLRMKHLFFLLLSLPFFAQSQDCKLVKEVDPYTKEVKLSTGFISLPGSTLTVDADSKELDFFFEVSGKCFNDASTVYIFFEGSRTRMTYRNAGSMNCDGYFHFKFRNGASTPGILTKLGTQKVTQFIFKATDSKETIITLTPDQQKLLMEKVTCITAEGKTLVK